MFQFMVQHHIYKVMVMIPVFPNDWKPFYEVRNPIFYFVEKVNHLI
jgi:hypothetical protein